MSWVAAAVVGGAVVGGIATSSAAGKQSDAANNATDISNQQYQQTRADMEPWRAAGQNALSALQYGMGIGGAPAGSTGAAGPALTEQQIRQELMGQFTTTSPYTGGGLPQGWRQQTVSDGQEGGIDVIFGPDGAQYSLQDGLARAYAQGQVSNVDNAGLDAAVQKRLADQTAAAGSRANDPNYGALLRSFSAKDFEADPGYQFRLEQGQLGLDRAAAASGGLNSGRAFKDAQAYTQGMASQEYQNAYNRFGTDQSNVYNRLAGVAGTGQTATNQLAAYGTQNAANAANNVIAAGNASAAGTVGIANGITGAIGQGLSSYNQNNILKSLTGGTGQSALSGWGGSAADPWYG